MKLALLLLSMSISATPAHAKDSRELPHYFPPGVIQSTDAVRQLQEYMRYLTATRERLNGADPPSIAGSDSISIETDLESTSSALNTDKPTKMRLVLDHYVRLSDGCIRVTFSNDQKCITERQLQVVIHDILATVNEAADLNFEFYSKEMMDRSVKARAEKLGIDEQILRKILDMKIPGYKHGITFRELHYLPKPMRRSDFIPRELHLGYTPQGVLGMAWLNTGVVYYSPQARIVDYLTNKPKVLQHEMVHNNINLQKFPLSEGFDVELMASIPEVLYDENQIDLFFHGYVAVPRELIRIYFGFDFAQARKDIFRYDLGGNIAIDEQKFREYSQKLTLVKEELREFFRDTIIPEFYSDPVWWSAMNEKRVDRNSLLRIMMSAHYNPTILGNEKETMKWLEAHEEEIREMAKTAFDISGTPLEKGVIASDIQIPHLLVQEYQRIFTDRERARIEEHFRNNPDAAREISRMPIPELLRILRNIAGRRMELER
jgi:hypothetical protein